MRRRLLKRSVARTYADDTNLSVTTRTTVEARTIANENLENVIANKLSLNLTKIEYILIASNFKILQLGNEQQIHIGLNDLCYFRDKK